MEQSVQPPAPETDELDSYSFEELLDLNQRLQAQLKKRQDLEVQAHIEKTRLLAKTLGISVEQMFGFHAAAPGLHQHRTARSSTRPPRTIAYRDPSNPGNVASTKGPKPQWFKDFLANGGDPETIRVHE